jgi:hypothetical protein
VRPAARLYRIAGTLTDSVTGEAIAGATMSLYSEEPQGPLQTALTDAQGRFALDPMPAGKYSLGASRRGYVTAYLDQHGDYWSGVVTGEGQDTEHIAFHLNTGGMIRGIVTDDSGDPVENAQVLLVRKSRDEGLGERLVRSIEGNTDDTGLFEYWNLLPGTYFLAVKAAPWYALHPVQSQQGGPGSDEQSADMAALDVAYPVTYFDNTTDEASATPIQLEGGDRVQANVVLHAAPALHLTFRSSAPIDEERRWSVTPMLRQTIFGEESAFSAPAGVASIPTGPGSYEITGVAPGHYSVLQGSPQKITEIDATGSHDLDLSAATPTFNVEVRAQMADGSAVPQTLNMRLISDDSMHRQITGRFEDKGHVQFDSVPPGQWNVLAAGGNVALSVIGVGTGSEMVAGGQITVRDRPVNVNVMVAAGKCRIQGMTSKDGKGEAGVMIVLVPKDPAANLTMFRRDQSDSDGSFSFRDVVEGEYTVVAIEDGWDLDWAEPRVIAPYLRGGVSVTVMPSSAALMRLRAPVRVQGK